MSSSRTACVRNILPCQRISYVNFVILMDEMQSFTNKLNKATGRQCWRNPVRDDRVKLLSFKAGAQI